MKRNTLIIIVALILTTGLVIASCVTAKITDKSGSQLWSENCQRCHNTPPSSAFTNSQWEVINTHMRQRAMLTEDEYKKITEFMQAGE
ncbi:MAG: cytochrome c [Sphingobacteriales bacterium]|nr:MAG: cytochrome c [Sphingobacteriales bacterium]